MIRHLRPLLGTAAAIGFLASLLVHISALLGAPVATQSSGVWLLHIGILVVFIPFVLLARQDLGASASPSQLSTLFPRWVLVVGAVLFAYAIVNFMLFMVGSEGGSPVFEDGRYLLLNHGTLIREITAEEYASFMINELRGFSGHWLVFYFIASAYFLFGKKLNASVNRYARGT